MLGTRTLDFKKLCIEFRTEVRNKSRVFDNKKFECSDMNPLFRLLFEIFL